MSRPLPPCAVNLIWLDEIDSTNALAARLVDGWLDGGHERLGDTIVIAGSQLQGRGRGSHRWQSPPGGAYVTWLGWVTRTELPWVPLAAGVSLCESIEYLCREARIGLEWPNDLRIRGRKLAGVLCQARGSEEEAWAAVGFGVNVEVAPDLGPDDAAVPISLVEAGFTGNVVEFSRLLAVGFAIRFRALLGHAEETRARWMSRTVHELGEPIRVLGGGAVVEGRFAGLAWDGRLLVEVGGSHVPIASGEIVSTL